FAPRLMQEYRREFANRRVWVFGQLLVDVRREAGEEAENVRFTPVGALRRGAHQIGAEGTRRTVTAEEWRDIGVFRRQHQIEERTEEPDILRSCLSVGRIRLRMKDMNAERLGNVNNAVSECD